MRCVRLQSPKKSKKAASGGRAGSTRAYTSLKPVIMSEQPPTPEFKNASREELLEELSRLRARNAETRREMKRSQVIANMVRKLYRIEYMEVPAAELAGVFLKLVAQSLSIDRAVLLKQVPEDCFEIMSLLHDNKAGKKVLKDAEFVNGFTFVNGSTPDSDFKFQLTRLLGVDAFLWDFDEDSGLALALGHSGKDSDITWRFDEGDREMVELALSVYVSVAERNRAERKLVHDAFHDSLTDLPNRNRFIQHLERAIYRSARSPEYIFSVLFIDMDRLKLINDSYGHEVGDQLLHSFAERLSGSVRPGDVVARLGGDEFAVLADGLNDKADVELLAERIIHDLNQPFVVQRHTISASASIGIAKGASTYESAEELLRDADIAMYRAKASGGGRHRMFDTGMHLNMVARLKLESELHEALDEDDLRLLYQPIYDLRDDRLVSCEALLRWQHKQDGLLGPGEFVHLAEESGLAIAMGRWVLERACQDLKYWDSTLKNGVAPSVSVNISDREFSMPDFIDNVTRTLKRSGVDASRVQLELTERMLLDYGMGEKRLLERLKSLGLRIMVDDFGTGYSSLSRLQALPIDIIKVDRSFVKDIVRSEEKSELVRMIISLGRSLNIKVVAEGVETKEQLARLRELDCDFAQGFYLGIPMNAKLLANLVESGTAPDFIAERVS